MALCCGDAPPGQHWLALCADSTGNGEESDTSEHHLQYKLERNKKKAPSRRAIQGKKRRKQTSTNSGAEASEASREAPAEGAAFGSAYTREARRAIHALLPWLREAGIVRGPISITGALAVAFLHHHGDRHGPDSFWAWCEPLLCP